jgi:YD repeat-containing protein
MQSIDLTFNAEDRVVQVHKDGSEVASFTYDGNGARVQKQAPDGAVTTYVGGTYEVQGSVETSYYYAAGQRVAMRRSPAGSGDGALTFLHSDHLGSTSLTTNGGGGFEARVRAKAAARLLPSRDLR